MIQRNYIQFHSHKKLNYNQLSIVLIFSLEEMTFSTNLKTSNTKKAL